MPEGMRQSATQCVGTKCGVVSGRLATKGIRATIDYEQHTIVEKLDYFGGGYVGLCERLGGPKIPMVVLGKNESDCMHIELFKCFRCPCTHWCVCAGY